ncbi:YfhD family protein [Paenibacillus sp. H1-7]|uniref:YfhD family protein n=1 Tax=Paenibacillus sp. H1-7 TaxID=2282849 RepID=UPI001EF8C8CE|nr:YfhD family protein [Paenibacillus sp. H1-7]ULL17672.1 YfhD family protein [Paenibacillus sp. H1-7]
MKNKQQSLQKNRKLPIAKNEDVDYSAEMADENDLEAVERANQADTRQQQS